MHDVQVMANNVTVRERIMASFHQNKRCYSCAFLAISGASPQQNRRRNSVIAAIHANKIRSAYASHHVFQQQKFDIK
jgi:hypothetical protein